MNKEMYFEINFGNCDCPDLDDDWLSTQEKFSCEPLDQGGCGAIQKLQQLDIVLEKPVNVPFTKSWRFPIGIIREDLLDAITQDLICQSFFVGSVSFSDSRTKLRFFSCVPRLPLVAVRGDSCSFFRRCELCGIAQCRATGDNKYLLKTDLDQRTLYAGKLASIFVNESVAERVLSQNFRDLYLKRLSVLPEPIDGLPVDLESLPKDFKRGP